MRYLLAMFLIVHCVGCSTSPKVESKPVASTAQLRQLEFKDQFLVVPPHFFQETAQSKSVIAGSKFYAQSNYCELIRRYKLKTNVDFNSAINLFKYRAYFMGASRVVFVDSDARTLQDKSGVEMIFHPGMPKDDASVSLIVGDLYECPSRQTGLY
jgi:hypothetical protein